MSIASWLSWTSAPGQGRRGQRRNPVSRSKKTRLFLEQLEGRALLSSYSAASVSDLIADITAANTAGGANTITLTAATTAPYVLTAVNNGSSSQGSANGLPVIAANDNLTIVGNGDTIERSTVSGTPDFRLLQVASGGSLTLENLTLQGGFEFNGSSGYAEGGATLNSGALTLNGVIVQNNTARGNGVQEGGGICSSAGSVTLEGGTIVVANSVNIGSYSFGGGLYASGGTVTVTNATFESNTAGAYGGGLDVANSTVTVTNATLENNVAGSYAGNWSYGGGMCVSGGKVTLTNDMVESNTAIGGESCFGGGLYVFSGTVVLNNDTVESNRAGTVGQGSNGGGVYVAGGSVTLQNGTVVESNSAFGSGGGLYIGGTGLDWTPSYPKPVINVTLANVTVESNTASYIGGGIYAAPDYAPVYGVYFGEKLTLTNDTVESNTAGIYGVAYGGGLYVGSGGGVGTVTLTNDTIEFNSCGPVTGAYLGGGIYISSGATVFLDSFTVANTINNTDDSGLNGSTANIDGSYSEARALVISGPSTVTGGVAFSITVTAYDTNGNVATGNTGTVHFTCTDGSSTLPADYTFTASDKGTHTFTGLVLNKVKKAPMQSITVTDTLFNSVTGNLSVDVS